MDSLARYKHLSLHYETAYRLIDEDKAACLLQTGDWEVDTVMGKGGKRALLTRVERKTLYTVIMRLTGKQSALLAKGRL